MTTATFPFDPTGVASTNLITGELQPVQAFNYEDFYLIVPDNAPFYATSLTVSYNDGINASRLLVENIDYSLVLPYWGATRSIGMPIYGGISIMSLINTGNVLIEYQTIGGVWTANRQAILNTLINNLYNPRAVLWDLVNDITDIFPAIEFASPIDNTSDINSLNNTLLTLVNTVNSEVVTETIIPIGTSASTNITVYAPLVNGEVPLQYIPSLSNLYATLTANGLINISQLPNLSSFYTALTSNGTVAVGSIPNLSSLYAALTSSGTLAVKQIPNISAMYAALTSTGTIAITEVPDLSKIYAPLVNGKIPCVNMAPCISAYYPTVEGATTVLENSINTYKITDYSILINYVVTAISGTVTISGGTITYTAPNSVSNSGFILNGVTFNLTIKVSNIIATPTVTSPVNSSTGITINNLSLTSSAFTMSNGTDTQASASWELATDSGFLIIVQSSMASTTNLTSWTVTGLALDTVYYARVLYTGVTGESSAYSSTVYFTTEIIALPTSIIAEITSSNGATGDEFGYSVAVNSTGTMAIIGAPLKNIGANSNQGATYIFQLVSGVWTQMAELLSSNGAAGDWFGFSVAMNPTGNTIAIGAIHKYTGKGAIYVFENVSGTWTQMAELTAINGTAGDTFGVYASLNYVGDTVVIGAYTKTIGANNNQGAAYIFRNLSGSWTQMAELLSSDGAAGDGFGVQESINYEGNVVIITARDKNSNTGAAYVFQVNSNGVWIQVAKLTASNGVANDWFGQSVSLNSTGNIVVIGASGKAVGANSNQGVAYIFQVNSSGFWTQVAELLATDAAGYDQFGWTVFIDSVGDKVVIGAPFKQIGTNTQQGATYVFQNTSSSWTQVAELTVSNGAAYDRLGWPVVIDDDLSVIFMGAPWRTVGNNINQGAVYVA